MFRKFVRDESGIALGLAVIMIVLIGVMGAGLLVFVRNDLNAVVEVNQGQKALNLADAGVQAAERQLLSNAAETDYDADDSNGDTPWSPFNNGKDMTIDGETVNVEIQYLLPSDTSSELQDPDHAPELVPTGETDYPEPEDYFKITADATIGDARRKVEAIYYTMDMGVPKGYYTPGNIEIKGTACVDSVSLFAQGNITFSGGGGCIGDTHMTGTDQAYGDWEKQPFNFTPRPTTDAGAGAVGSITGGSAMLNTRDFDNTTSPQFIEKDPPDDENQTSDQITFPFDYALPDIDFLRDIAKQQMAASPADKNHRIVPDGDSNETVLDWPDGSTPSTVVYYEFKNAGSNSLKWGVSGSCTDDPPKQGILVVENASFTTQPKKALFRGVVVVRGGEVSDGSSDDTGKTCLEGFINAEGTVKIAGNVSPANLPPDTKRPGFYGVDLWSWRECYNEACN